VFGWSEMRMWYAVSIRVARVPGKVPGVGWIVGRGVRNLNSELVFVSAHVQRQHVLQHTIR
jgi:hypothetical protein